MEVLDHAKSSNSSLYYVCVAYGKKESYIVSLKGHTCRLLQFVHCQHSTHHDRLQKKLIQPIFELLVHFGCVFNWLIGHSNFLGLVLHRSRADLAQKAGAPDSTMAQSCRTHNAVWLVFVVDLPSCPIFKYEYYFVEIKDSLRL
jgi:hypothetical protein